MVSPAPDGNCGFRCLVHVLKKGSGGQGAFAEIKDEMLACLQAKKAWYLQSKVYLPDQVDRLEFILKEKRTFVDERYWFSVPDCAQLASDTFNIPIKVFSFDDAQGNILFLPLNNTRYTKYKPITLQLHGLCPDFFYKRIWVSSRMSRSVLLYLKGLGIQLTSEQNPGLDARTANNVVVTTSKNVEITINLQTLMTSLHRPLSNSTWIRRNGISTAPMRAAWLCSI